MVGMVMLDRLMALFSSGPDADPDQRHKQHDAEELKVAAASLMVQAARMDGTFEEVERETIRAALQSHFQMSAADAEALIEEGHDTIDESTELYSIIRVIRDHLAPEERVSIIEMLWEVAYADGEVDDYEANLVRRVAGLLYVPDRDSGAARKRVEERGARI
jgi:uncharacterized tellurite resistance protein B-like protein